jgi:hypothetical protein
MEALDFAWELHGGTSPDVKEVLKESWKWFVRFAEWVWKFAQPLVCYLRSKPNNSKKREDAFMYIYIWI